MKKLAIAFLFAALSLFVGAEELSQDKEFHYTLISPHAYVEDWSTYLKMRAEQRPDVAFTLKNAAEIYESYPFDPAAVDGAPRNPAESIHAWIRETMKDVPVADRGKYYFVLGGSFTDAQTITKTGDERLNKYIPGVYVRPRFSPEANIQVGEPYYSISDMFYACLDVKEGEWPWDANKNGKYADNQEAGSVLNDYGADVIVSRIPIEKHSAGAKAVIAAFKAKVARVEDKDFAGKYRFALAGGQCSNSNGRINISDGNTLRDEHEFYDGGLNMFDPRHGGIWVDSELVPRKTVKNTTVKYRPVLEGNPMFMYTWGAEHPSIDEAVAHFYAHDYDYMEYRDHGSASDLYCKYINSDAYLSATGLTRMIISGFSCMTGYIDGPGISLAEAEILSPKGGTVASVHNSRYGVNFVGTDLKDNAGLSSTLQYLIKQGVLEKNMDIGQAWLYARQKFGATADQALFVSAEQLLLGDPLIKLPSAVPETTLEETEIVVDKDTGYTTLNVKGGTKISGDHLFKVMQGMKVTTKGDLTFAADGGVGGKGIEFSEPGGSLAIASPNKSYFVQPTGANKVLITGSGTTLDFSSDMPKFEELCLIGNSTRQAGNVLRGRTEGQLKNLLPLSIENTEVALGTVDAFKGANSGTFATVSNGGLGITFNPNYGLENSWEYFVGSISLDGGNLFVDRTSTAGFGRPDKPGLTVDVAENSSIETRNGGKATLFGTTTFNVDTGVTLTFGAAILRDEKTDGKIVINGGRTIVESADGIGGEVTISGGVLVLKELPLKNVTKLTLLGESKLVIPTNEEGYYQVLSGKGVSLSISAETRVYSLGDENTPIVGRSTTTGAIFDVDKFAVWDKATGDWADTASGQTKIYFPDIEGVNEVVVSLPEALTCAFAVFGNQNSTYRFTGEPLTLGNAVLSERIVFENEVSAPNGVVVESGKIDFATLRTPRLTIKEDATISAAEIVSKIETIKGIRFYPIKTNSNGKTASIYELQFNTTNGKLPLESKNFSYTSDIGSVTNEGYLHDGVKCGFEGNSICCEITANNVDDLSKEKFYIQYSFDQNQPMPVSYYIAASNGGVNKTQSLTSFRVDVTSDSINWVTVSNKSKVTVPNTGLGDMWYNPSDPAFKFDNPPAEIYVEKGGALELAGSVSGTIHLAAESILKVGSGAMTLGSSSKIVLPDEGFAYIDCSEVDLTDNSEPLTILSGLTLTEADLAHLTTRGKPWMKLGLINGSLTLSLDKKPPKVLFR